MSNVMFVDAASTGRNEIWRYLLALPVLLLGFVLSVVFLIVVALGSHWIFSEPKDMVDALGMVVASLDHPWRWGQPYPPTSAVLFAGFLVSVFLLAFGPAAALRFLHKRSIRSLITCGRPFRWVLFGRSFAAALVALVTWTVVDFIIYGENYRITPDVGAFLVSVAIVLLLVPLQVLGEEAVFRGYVLQSVAWFSRVPAVRLLVPSVLFFAIHLGGKEMGEGGVGYVFYYAVIAFYFTWLAIRTDGLEACLGLHVAINYVALIAVADDVRSVSSPTLYYASEPDSLLVVVLALWLVTVHYWCVVRGRFLDNQTRTPVGSSGSPASPHSASS